VFNSSKNGAVIPTFCTPSQSNNERKLYKKINKKMQNFQEIKIVDRFSDNFC
jgi:hypothetical protein